MSEYDGRQKLWKQEPIPEEVKAAIAGKLLANERPVDIAEEYGVSLATVSRIKTSKLSKELLARMREDQQMEMAELMSLSLTESIEAGIRIMAVTKDKSWLSTQKASDLGVFYGVIADKFAKTMEAIEHANGSDDPEAQNIEVE